MTDESVKKLAERLRGLRTAQGLSQTDVAEVMTERGHDWNQSTVWKTEAGRRGVRIGELEALSVIFGQSVTALLGIDGVRTASPDFHEAAALVRDLSTGDLVRMNSLVADLLARSSHLSIVRTGGVA